MKQQHDEISVDFAVDAPCRDRRCTAADDDDADTDGDYTD